MKTIALPRALTLVLVGATLASAPTRAVGQVTTVTGRVTNESGIGLSNIYVGVLGVVTGRTPDGEAIVERAETRTAPDGTYLLKVPFGSRTRYHEVRVRDAAYEPQARTVLVGATVEENFRLKVDTYASRRADAVRAGAVAKVYGKVTTEAGVGIDSAQVYINDLNLVVRTNAAGEFSFETPAVSMMTNLRVRAIGYLPGVQIVQLGLGPQEKNFKLKSDPGGPRDETPASATKAPGTTTKTTSGAVSKMPANTRATEPARVPYSVARAAGVPSVEIPVAADPFNRYLFQPELVMRHQDALGLTEDQRAKLQAAMEEAQKRAIQVQWALALENEKIQKTLDKNTVDEAEVVAQMDRIVGVEREMKRAQLQMLIKIKNTLTAAQQDQLRRLRGFDQ